MNYKIPKIAKNENGRRIAIGDVHGCFYTLKTLIERLELTKDDQLFLLGDLILKGDFSKEVVDYTMKLQADGLSVFVVKGNHEATFLMAYDYGMPFFIDYLESQNMEDFLDGDMNEYLRFFGELEYCYDLGDWLVCHSEFLQNGEKSFYRGMRGLFPNIAFEITDTEISDKRQISGHTVNTLASIKADIEAKAHVIGIDSGCVYHENEGLGFLSAFDLDKETLISVAFEG